MSRDQQFAQSLEDISNVNNYRVKLELLAGDDPVMQAFVADVRKAHPKGDVTMHDLITVLAGERKPVKVQFDAFTFMLDRSWVEKIAVHPVWESQSEHIHDSLRNYAWQTARFKPDTVTEELNLLSATVVKRSAQSAAK